MGDVEMLEGSPVRRRFVAGDGLCDGLFEVETSRVRVAIVAAPRDAAAPGVADPGVGFAKINHGGKIARR